MRIEENEFGKFEVFVGGEMIARVGSRLEAERELWWQEQKCLQKIQELEELLAAENKRDS